jgi:hypothetical protein
MNTESSKRLLIIDWLLTVKSYTLVTDENMRGIK